MRKNLFIVITLVLAVLVLTTPKPIRAADNMCNVNPGSCSSESDWIAGWYAAREPEKVSAEPQQTEWTNASQPEPEVIRVANEDNSVNRSQIAADDAAARGGDPVNPSTVTVTAPPPGGCPAGTVADGVTCKLGTAVGTTAAPTATLGTGGGGGTPCSGPFNHTACNGKAPGDQVTYGGVAGTCNLGQSPNCSWTYAGACSPGACEVSGTGSRKCNSSGTGWIYFTGANCTSGGTGGTPTAAPSSIGSTGGEKPLDRPKTACYAYSSSGVCTAWDATGSKPADLNVAGCNLYNSSGVCTAWDATTGGEKPGDTTRTKPMCNVYNSTGNCISWDPTGSKPADLNVAGCKLYSTNGICFAWDVTTGGEKPLDRPKTVCNLYGPTGICFSWDPTQLKPADLSISGCQRYNSGGTCIAWIPTLGTCNTYNSAGICTSWDPTGSKPADLNVAGCKLYNSGGTCIAWDVVGSASLPNGSGGSNTTSSGVCAGLGGINQICRVPQNCGNASNCDGGLICDNGTCKTISPGTCGSGSNGCRVHNCSVCSNYGGGLDECRSGGTVTDCASAKLSGSCGQIDLLDAGGNYCGVMQQACTGSCAGGVATTMGGGAPAAGGGEPAAGGGTPAPTAPAVGEGIAAACVATQLYLGGSTTPASAAQIASLAIGDTIRLAIKGNLANFTKGRFVIKLNNSVVTTQETTTKRNLPGDPAAFEFIYDYTITQGGSYSVEGSIWQ